MTGTYGRDINSSYRYWMVDGSAKGASTYKVHLPADVSGIQLCFQREVPSVRTTHVHRLRRHLFIFLLVVSHASGKT